MSLFRLFSRRAIRPAPTRLRMELLEGREVPAVSILGIANSEFPSNKPLFVPVTVDSADGPVSYTVESSNAGDVTAELLTGGRSVRFTVSGKDANNQAISGRITLRLFEDIAPLASNNIIQLVKNGYYSGKQFHRIVNDFVIQGGSPNGDGQGGSPLVNDVRDEYNAQYTFASRGIVALANAGDDNNNAQFFVTDPFIVSGGTEVDAPLDRRSQFLNFNHTVVGIMTEGFDIYQQIMNVPKVLGSDGAVSSPTSKVLIEDAELIEGERDENGVLKITAQGGFLGSASIKVVATANGESQDKTFTVTSVADTVNDRPFLGSLSNLSTGLNAPLNFTLPFTELDAGDTPTFVVGRVVTTANGPVFTTLDPTQGSASVSQDGRVTFTPANNFTGALRLTVGVRDAQDRIGSSLGLNDARNFDTEVLTVDVGNTPGNTAPTITVIADQTVVQGQLNSVNFTINDTETAAADLVVRATSSNPSLIPDASITVGGSGASRNIGLTPATGQTGTAIITVSVRDAGNLTQTRNYTVTVTDASGNTAPTISAIRDQSAIRGQANTVNFTIADGQDDLASISVTAISSNATLFPSSGISLGGANASRTLIATPASGQTGTATITVTVTDAGGLTAVETYTITVGDVSVTLTGSKATTTVGDDVLLMTTISTGSGFVQFFNGTSSLGTVPVIEGKAFFPASFASAGAQALRADFTPTGGTAAISSNSFALSVAADSSPKVIITADGQAAGTDTQVIIRNADGSVRFTVDPYPNFRGVIRTRVADVTNDGQLDVVSVPGFGGGPLITVYDGATGLLTYQKMIFEDRFRGGLNLDVGDAQGLGYAQILVGAGNTGGPRVTLLDASQDKVLLNYFAYNTANRGGVTVAISDLRGGNQSNIITGNGQGLAPTVNVYNPYTTSGLETPRLFGSFAAGDKTTTAGIRVGSGPLIESAEATRRDVLVGPLDLNDVGELRTAFNPIALGVFVG